MDDHGDSDGGRRPTGFLGGRRDFLTRTGSVVGAAALAGCNMVGGGDGDGNGDGSNSSYSPSSVPEPRTYAADELYEIDEWRGDGPLVRDRPDEYTGLSVLDLPDLRGELTVYLGGGEGGRYVDAMKRVQNLYRDFTVNVNKASSSQLANTIIEETTAGRSPADIFWAIDAGSVGVVAESGATVELPAHVTRSVPETYHPSDQWVGIMGRARSVPYNTDELAREDVPDTVLEIPEESTFQDAVGWAPTYGAFQSFVTAMRVLNGRERTREWLEGMQELGVTTYSNEFAVANAVASGELRAGFSNHYYSRLVYEERPDAPLELAFTRNDAGALVNCSAAEVIAGTANERLAADFVHHLLSIEVQEFLCTRGYGYPLLPSVPPIGDLPRIDELDPPAFDLQELANVRPTLRLLREAGVL